MQAAQEGLKSVESINESVESSVLDMTPQRNSMTITKPEESSESQPKPEELSESISVKQDAVKEKDSEIEELKDSAISSKVELQASVSLKKETSNDMSENGDAEYEKKRQLSEKKIATLESSIQKLNGTIQVLKSANAELVKKSNDFAQEIKNLKALAEKDKESNSKKIKSLNEELSRVNRTANDSFALQKTQTDSLLIQLEELRSIQKNDETVKTKLSELNFSLEEQVYLICIKRQG